MNGQQKNVHVTGAAWRRLAVGLLAVAVLAPAAPAPGQPTTEWIASLAPLDWHDPNNWSFGVPLPMQDAIIDVPDGWAVIGMMAPAVGEANAVTVGVTAPSTLEIWLGSTLEANSVHIGPLGMLTTVEDWTHRGGLLVEGLVAMNGLNLTLDEGGTGEILGGAVLDANDLIVGGHVVGALNQVAGLVAAERVRVGEALGSIGDVNLVDAQLDANASLTVGIDGLGMVIQDRGDVTSPLVALGWGFTGSGIYELNDGNLSAGSASLIAAEEPWSPGLWIGVDGEGAFTQNGGLVDAANVGIALSPNSVGTYEMNGGVLQTSVGWALGEAGAASPLIHGGLTVGSDGNGTFTQNAGDVVADIVAVGSEVSGLGRYELIDGSLTVGGGLFPAGETAGAIEALGPGMLLVGMEGVGVFDQQGGGVSAMMVGIGTEATGVGTYEMKGGSLDVSGGALIVGMDGNGTFVQTGGDVFAGAVAIGESPGSTGAVEVLDGTLTVGGELLLGEAETAQAQMGEIAVGIGGAGTYAQSGGIVFANGMCIAADFGSAGTASLLGGQTILQYILLGQGDAQLIYDGGQLLSPYDGPIHIEYGWGRGDVLVTQGTLDLDWLVVGSYGDNSFHQTGGTVNVGGMLIGDDCGMGGLGALYRMTGGDLNVCSSEGGYLVQGAGASAGELGVADLAIHSEGTLEMEDGYVGICNGSLYVGDTCETAGLAEALISGGTVEVLREGYAPDQWYLPPRGHVFVGGTNVFSEGVLEFSGGTIRASRLYIGPLSEPGEWYAAGEVGVSGGHDPIPIAGPGRMIITGGAMHLDGDGDSYESPSTIGGLLIGYGTIVSAGPIRVLQDAAVVAADGTLTIDGEMQSNGQVDVLPGAALRTRGVLDGVVTNDGTLAALNGDLRLTGQVVNTGLLSNRPGTNLHVASPDVVHTGSVRSYVGGAVSFPVPIAVLPGQSIDLRGGTVEAPEIVNDVGGTMTGHGTIVAESGGLTNLGVTDFDGTTWLLGPLYNEPGGWVNVTNGDLHVSEPSVNNGDIKITNGEAHFDGGLIDNGYLDIDPAVATVGGDLIVAPTGVITLDANSKLQVRANFGNASTQRTLFDLAPGTVQFHGWGVQGLEAAGEDLGPVHAGWSDNFAMGTLIVELGADLELLDVYDNILDGDDNEAVYADTLILASGVWVERNGRNLYYRNGGAVKVLLEGDFDLSGTIDEEDLDILKANFGQSGKGWIEGDTDGDKVIDHFDYLVWKDRTGWASPGEAPEPTTVVLLGLGGAWALLRRRRRK